MKPGQTVFVRQPRPDIPRPACCVLRVFRRGRHRVAEVRFFDDGEVREIQTELLSEWSSPAGSRRRPAGGRG